MLNDASVEVQRAGGRALLIVPRSSVDTMEYESAVIAPLTPRWGRLAAISAPKAAPMRGCLITLLPRCYPNGVRASG